MFSPEFNVFTTFIPSEDICEAGGTSYLWGRYFETGTDYYNPIFSYQTVTLGGVVLNMGVSRVSLGSGLAASPSLHSGSSDGSTAFVQTSTGEIKKINQKDPLNSKTGKRSWKVKE